MFLGLLVSLGTTKLSAVVLGIILCYLIILVIHKQRRIHVPVILWVLVGLIAITALWSPESGKPVWLSLHILCGWIAYQVLPHSKFRLGLYPLIAIQIVVILWQYGVSDVTRPTALARNASVLGLAGMWLLPGILPAFLSGLSISRTAVLGAVLIGVSGRRYLFTSLIVVLTFVVTTWIVQPERLGLSGISDSLELRKKTLNGSSVEALPINESSVTPFTPRPIIPEPQKVNWKWYGYGFGQYSFVTGRIQPHNIFVSTWYAFGLLTIPVGYCLIYLWTLRNRGRSWREHDWRLLLLACTTGMLTDELLGSVEGVYMVLGWCIMNRSAQQVVNRLGTADLAVGSNAAISQPPLVPENET